MHPPVSISFGNLQEFNEYHGNSWKSAGIPWNSKKSLGIRRNFLGILRNFLGFEEIPWKSVDAAQDAMPGDRPSSPFAAFACKTNRIPCLRGRPARVRSAPAGQLFLGNPQKYHENDWISWQCAGYPWNPMKYLGSRRNSLGMCKDFIRFPLSFTPPGPPAETTSKS